MSGASDMSSMSGTSGASNRSSESAAWPEVMRGALPVLRKLEACGEEAVLVGGCVRDWLAGRPVHDVDIATSATPERVMALFERTTPTGLQHGTVTVLWEGAAYEVTTYRQEGAYADHRRPQTVHYVRELHADLLRRDFTINAMALTTRGELIDPFGGQADLQAGLIRAVGNPEERMQEDALRMLRGIRFAAAYATYATAATAEAGDTGDPLAVGIEAITWQAIVRCRPLLERIAMERVGTELDKMLRGPAPDWACTLLLASGLLMHTKHPLRLPPTMTAYAVCVQHAADMAGGASWRQMPGKPAARLPRMPAARLVRLPKPEQRWAAWLLRHGLDERQAQQWLLALRLPGAYMRAVLSLITCHAHVKSALSGTWQQEERLPYETWITIVLTVGRVSALDWLLLAQNERYVSMQQAKRLRSIAMEMPVEQVGELAVDGSQLIEALSLAPGPWLKRCLGALLHAVAGGHLSNNKNVLLAYARQWAKEEQR